MSRQRKLPELADTVTVETRKVIGERGALCKRHPLLHSAMEPLFEAAADFHIKRGS